MLTQPPSPDPEEPRMEHGTEAYFAERERNARRLFALSMTIGVALLAGVFGLRATPLGTVVRESRLMRFGLEGPPRFVQLVQVEAEPAQLSQPRNVGRLVIRSGRAGAAGGPPATPVRRQLSTHVPDVGPGGQAGHDLVARALASRGQVPIFQSDDLVIDVLVRPQYPEDARARGVEGRVAVLARVDTLGRVVEAEVMNASGESSLDAASRVAVLQCRFRPYRANDRVQEVYAVFRFSFRIY